MLNWQAEASLECSCGSRILGEDARWGILLSWRVVGEVPRWRAVRGCMPHTHDLGTPPRTVIAGRLLLQSAALFSGG